ncbi:MAG: ATP synthase F1 subunit epsilon [Calditrichaeota bacterium]|nr:ATP synthase F1 subunit epsilon [Calditrichota bacterium]
MEIVTPLGVLFKSKINHVRLPGVEGYFGVLAGHEPFVTSLKTGEAKVDLESGETKYFAVTGGIAEILPEKITVLVETAEEAHEIDLESAYAAKDKAAHTLMTEQESKLEIERAKKSLEHAITRIRVAERLQSRQ